MPEQNPQRRNVQSSNGRRKNPSRLWLRTGLPLIGVITSITALMMVTPPLPVNNSSKDEVLSKLKAENPGNVEQLKEDYAIQSELLQKIRKLRRENANSETWKKFSDETLATIAPMTKRLENTLKYNPRSLYKPARRQLYLAVKYRFNVVLTSPLCEITQSERDIEEHLAEAAKLLGISEPE